MLVRIPPEQAAVHVGGFPFSLADVLTAAGIDLRLLHSVSIFGTEWQPAAMITTVPGSCASSRGSRCIDGDFDQCRRAVHCHAGRGV